MNTTRLTKPSLYLRGLAVLIMATVSIGPLTADPDAEREALANLITEIELLLPLVDEAQRHANENDRVRFRYDWLRQDVTRIRQGIQEHVDGPRMEPRSVPPLRGNYSR